MAVPFDRLDTPEQIRIVLWNRSLNAAGGVGNGERAADYVLDGVQPYIDRLAAERDAYKAERDALLDALHPALVSSAVATGGRWTSSGPYLYAQIENEDDNPDDVQIGKIDRQLDLAFIAAAANAVRDVAALQEARDA